MEILCRIIYVSSFLPPRSLPPLLVPILHGHPSCHAPLLSCCWWGSFLFSFDCCCCFCCCVTGLGRQIWHGPERERGGILGTSWWAFVVGDNRLMKYRKWCEGKMLSDLFPNRFTIRISQPHQYMGQRTITCITISSWLIGTGGHGTVSKDRFSWPHELVVLQDHFLVS